MHCVQIPISFPSKSVQCDKYIHSLLDIIFLRFIYFGFFPKYVKMLKKKLKDAVQCKKQFNSLLIISLKYPYI